MKISDEGHLADLLVTRELYLEGASRGAGDARPRDARDDVSYGRWQVDRLVSRVEISPSPRPDPERWDLYLVEIPYSLRFSDPARLPRWIEVAFELTNGEATVYDLVPDEVTEPVVGPRTYTLSSALRFVTAGEALRGTAHEISFGRLAPVIRALGGGESYFGWRHEAPPGGAVPAGYRMGCAVLQVARSQDTLQVRASARWSGHGRRKGRSDAAVFSATLRASR